MQITHEHSLNSAGLAREASPPLVVISILNWNGWQDTLECLASVQRLDYPNHLTVVVDNGSWDNSAERIKAWAHENLGAGHVLADYTQEIAFQGGDPQTEEALQRTGSPARLVLICTKDNLGFTGGNNLSISYALRRGIAPDYVFLLNNDARLEPDCLTQLVTADWRADAAMIAATLRRPGVRRVDNGSENRKTREPNAASANEEFDELVGERGSGPVMPQSRYRSGGFTPPFSGWRGKPAATFEIETEALRGPPGLENRQISEKLRKHSTALDAGGDLIPVTWASAGALLVRRDLLEGVKQIQGSYLDNRLFVYGEEIALSRAACRLGYKPLLAKRAVGCHRGMASTGGHWGALQFYYSTRNMFYGADYLPKFQRLCFRLMYPLKSTGRVIKYLLKGRPTSARGAFWGMIDAYRGVTGKWRNHDREANSGRRGGFLKSGRAEVG